MEQESARKDAYGSKDKEVKTLYAYEKSEVPPKRLLLLGYVRRASIQVLLCA